MKTSMAQSRTALPPVPAAVTTATRLRRDGRLTDAIAVVESALGRARSGSYDVPFRNRVLLALTLADLYVLAGERMRAHDLLTAEMPFAEHIFRLMEQHGTPDQVHAARAGVLQLRDRAMQVSILGGLAAEFTIAQWFSGSPTTRRCHDLVLLCANLRCAKSAAV